MNWLQRLRLARAISKLSRSLPAELRNGWGGSKYYTPGQVRTAMQRLAVRPPLDLIGYAAFLTQEDYATCAGADPQLSYVEARTLFERHSPFRSPYAHDPITDLQAVQRHGTPS